MDYVDIVRQGNASIVGNEAKSEYARVMSLRASSPFGQLFPEPELEQLPITEGLKIVPPRMIRRPMR